MFLFKLTYIFIYLNQMIRCEDDFINEDTLSDLEQLKIKINTELGITPHLTQLLVLFNHIYAQNNDGSDEMNKIEKEINENYSDSIKFTKEQFLNSLNQMPVNQKKFILSVICDLFYNTLLTVNKDSKIRHAIRKITQNSLFILTENQDYAIPVEQVDTTLNELKLDGIEPKDYFSTVYKKLFVEANEPKTKEEPAWPKVEMSTPEDAIILSMNVLKILLKKATFLDFFKLIYQVLNDDSLKNLERFYTEEQKTNLRNLINQKMQDNNIKEKTPNEIILEIENRNKEIQTYTSQCKAILDTFPAKKEDEITFINTNSEQIKKLVEPIVILKALNLLDNDK